MSWDGNTYQKRFDDLAHRRRLSMKPGLTCLWQVSGRSELTLEQMVALDVEYSQRRSAWLNLWIMARTIPAVLSGRGAS